MKLLIFLLTTTCFASNWVKPTDLKTVYVSHAACGKTCVCVDCETGVVPDLEIMKVEEGRIVEDSGLKKAKEDAKTAEETKKTEISARASRLKEASAKIEASTLSKDLKDILNDLLALYK